MLRVLLFALSLVLSVSSMSQVVTLHTVAVAEGIPDKGAGRFVFSEYSKDSTIVLINMSDSTITFNDKQFMIAANPTHWNVCRTYKWCTFWGYDSGLNKAAVKLFRYDNSNRSKICVFSRDAAWKFLGTE